MPIPHEPMRHRQPKRPLLRLTMIGLAAALVAIAVVTAGAVVTRFDRETTSATALAADDRENRDERADRGKARTPSTVVPSPTSSAAPKTSAPTRRSTAPKPAGPAVPIPSSCAGYAGNRAIGCALLSSYGFGLAEMPALDQLWTRESGWNHRATNPYSGAYGIPQALPGSKMGTVASDWQTNPATQIRWGLGYIRSRYGSPRAAWSFWQAHHWY